MPSREMLNLIWQELYGLEGDERQERTKELAERYQKSQATINRWANLAGIRIRSERSTKGQSKIDDQTAKLGASLQLCSRRRSNQVTMPTCDAKEILEDSGLLKESVSDGRFTSRIREIRMSAKHLCAPSPHVTLLSDHPNHVWQFDVTNCLQYFFDDKGRTGLNERDADMELYKNKIVKTSKAIKKELLRYVVVDHCTGAFYFRYFYASGEKAEDGERFFFEAMRPKDEVIRQAFNGSSGDKLGKYHFHGVPFIIYADRGSIARAKKLKNLYEALKIDFMTHLPGNPRAKGAVEGLMKIINRFESKLIMQRPGGLEDINAWALDWTIKLGGIDKFRGVAPRSALWQKIRAEQLRLCPEEPVFRRLVTTEPIRKKVSGGLLISHNGNSYRVSDPELANQYVFIRENAYESPAIDVHGNGYIWLLKPIPKDEFGRLSDGVRFGQYKAHKHTATQNAKTELEKIAAEQWGISWKGTGDKRRAVAPPLGHETPLQVFGHQSDKVRVEFINRTGTELDIKQPEMPDNKPIKADAFEIPRNILDRQISITDLLVEVKSAIGRIEPWLNQALRAEYAGGISKSRVDELVSEIKAGKWPVEDKKAAAGS